MGPDGKQDFVMAVSKYKKAVIVDLIGERTGTSRKEIRVIIDLFIDEIKTALKQNRVIELRGFGTFEVKTRKGRLKARNPKTGKSVEVNSHSIAFFRPGQELKKVIWNLPPAESGAGLAENNAPPPGGGAAAGEQ
jgi:integration host factor subunit beta